MNDQQGPRFGTRRLLPPLIALAIVAPGLPAQVTEPSTADVLARILTVKELKRRADRALKLPRGKAQGRLHVVHQYADHLFEKKKLDPAIKYLKSCVKLDAIDMEARLRLARLLKQRRKKSWRKEAELVAATSENGRLVMSAHACLDDPVKIEDPPWGRPDGDGATLVLVPLEPEDRLLAWKLAPELKSRLGIPVLVRSLEVKTGAPARNPTGVFIEKVRDEFVEKYGSGQPI